MRLFPVVPLFALACTAGSSPTVEADTDSDTDSDTDTDTDTDTDVDDGLQVAAVSVFQVVEVPVWDEAGAVPAGSRSAPVVAGRDARIVTWLDTPDAWSAADVEVRFVVDGTEHVVSDLVTVDADPSDPTTGLALDVPAGSVTAAATYHVEVWTGGVQTSRIPASGEAQLAAEETGPIAIHLVPYETNGFTPDTSQPVLDGFRDAVYAMYPVSGVDITVGDVRTWPDNDIGEILVDVGVVQEQVDQAPSHVYYYGLVSGVATRAEFEGITGSSESGVGPTPDRAYFAAGAAFGDVLSESTLVHELGHMHGLDHAPCGNASDTDPDFPMADGSTGTWGYDVRTDEYVPPETADVMGYCQPRWVGAYNYDLLVDQVQLAQSF